MDLEIRSSEEAIWTRSDKRGNWIAGYAALFNVRSNDLGGFVEVIRPGAFAESLKAGADVRALVAHDPDKLLARTSNQTLKVEEDGRGLKFEALVPDTTYGRDLLALIKLQTVRGMSFGFRVRPDGDAFAAGSDGKIVRTLRAVELREVSVTPYPAYEGTSVSVRGNRNHARIRPRLAAAYVRLRLLELA